MTPLRRATAEWVAEVRADERQRCASLVARVTMSEVLLAAGELTAGERRVVKALLPWLANKILSRKDA
jgi:hypothetical protein